MNILSDHTRIQEYVNNKIIPQINRFASKYNYSRLSQSILNQLIVELSLKCDTINGNTFTFVVNERLNYDLQTTLSEFLASHQTDGSYLYTKEGDKVKVGAEYVSYKFGGNEIIFHVDRALSYEYPDRGYGIMIDLSGDKASGRPAIEKFTIEKHELIVNELKGAGFENGPVSTAVAGKKLIVSGWQGVAVYNPYRTAILILSKY